jgi:AraC family transcriptional regulator
MEHVRRLRLERAAIQLKYTQQPIIHVAFDAGYETHESFTRAFSAMFACSPNVFRRMQHERLFNTADCNVHYLPNSELDDYQPLVSGEIKMDVRIEEMAARKVYFVRETGPYPVAAKAAWKQMCGWACPRGLVNSQTLMIGICHDDPQVTPSDKIRYDAAMTLDPDVKPEGEIGVQELPAGRYAVTTHLGPYETLNKTWSIFCDWLPQSGYVVRNGPSFEIYLNDPQSTSPNLLLTDLYAPVE